jgi:hypothetical protein
MNLKSIVHRRESARHQVLPAAQRIAPTAPGHRLFLNLVDLSDLYVNVT